MPQPRISKGTWSSSEDASLLRLVEQHKPNFNWKIIAEKIEGRNPKQCRERWTLNLDPTIRRGPWTAEEDAVILKGVSNLGSSWSKISKLLTGRTENQVKTRYNGLRRKQIRERVWSSEEDAMVVELLLKHGREYDLIAKELAARSKSERTKGQIKTRYRTVLQQQNPELMRQVYSVEASLREQRKSRIKEEHPVDNDTKLYTKIKEEQHLDKFLPLHTSKTIESVRKETDMNISEDTALKIVPRVRRYSSSTFEPFWRQIMSSSNNLLQDEHHLKSQSVHSQGKHTALPSIHEDEHMDTSDSNSFSSNLVRSSITVPPSSQHSKKLRRYNSSVELLKQISFGYGFNPNSVEPSTVISSPIQGSKKLQRYNSSVELMKQILNDDIPDMLSMEQLQLQNGFPMSDFTRFPLCR